MTVLRKEEKIESSSGEDVSLKSGIAPRIRKKI